MSSFLVKSICAKFTIVFLYFLATLFSISLQAQQKFSGVVLDIDDKTPLIGVNVIVNQTNIGTVTDFEGSFSISASVGDVIVFSFLGFKNVEHTVSSFDSIEIYMSEDFDLLSEIIVIGYGGVEKKDITGAVVSLNKEDLNRGNVVTPENLLQGRVAGLSINTGGEPGSGSVIRIRGGASLSASNDPLIVLDGLPIDNNTIGGSRSILSTINPNEIESFSILKDASATAIYGSRASNGVIIINTKKGSKALSVSIDSGVSYNTLANSIDVFNANEFRALITERYPTQVDKLGDSDTNWQDEIYEETISSNLNVSLNGSIANVPTRLSIGRSLQNGLRLTSVYERNTASISTNPNLFDNKLRIGVNANYSYERNRFASGQEGNALTFDPTQPVYDPTSPFGGFFQYHNDTDGELTKGDLTPNAPFNPVAELLQRKSVSDVYRLYGNIKVDYSVPFILGLTATVNLGLDKQDAEGTVDVSELNPLSQRDGSIIGSKSAYSNAQRNELFDGYLNYKNSFGNSDFDVTAGYSYQRFKSERFNSNELLDDGVDSEPLTNIDPDLVLLAYFSRFNLSIRDRYLLTLTYRRDGTSRFSKKNRWGDFPSVAIAWKANQDLFPNSETLSLLKFRLGWGITGQQDIGRRNLTLHLDNYIRGIPVSQYQFGNNPIQIGVPSFRNEDLKWEETTTYNAGVDIGLFESRFTASIDLFRKESSDLLVYAAVPDGSNFGNSGFQNIGEFTADGLEILLQGDVVKSKNDGFKLKASFNASFIRREIKNLFQNEDILIGSAGGGTGNNIQIHRVGYTPNSFFLYKQIYDLNGYPIESTYADLNGDNVINNEDRYIHHNSDPMASFGFASTLSYNKFDLSFNLRALVGNYVYNNVNSSRAQYSLLNNAVPNNIPKSVLETNFIMTENVILSDAFVENASFLKMDNITLGYHFDNIFSTNVGLNLSGSVQNVFTITKYSGLDPEVFNNGIDNAIYPRPRTFLLNANIQF